MSGALTWDVPVALEDNYDGVPALEHTAIPHGAMLGKLHPLAELQRQELSETSKKHLDEVVQQLLLAEGIESADTWAKVIADLAQSAAWSLSPAAVAADGDLDPRACIKVKQLQGSGVPTDSHVVRGIVLRKNVANRRMRSRVDHPRIIMLGGALQYQGVADKLASFEALQQQEKEYLTRAVARIASFQPDVLLVEAAVTRYAQEELLKRNISLVLNVKAAKMNRLARSLGCKVASTVEELTQGAVAQCRAFRVETLQAGSAPPRSSEAQEGASKSSSRVYVQPGASAPRTLMYFEGCPRAVGCTILISGGRDADVSKLKQIVKFAALLAYHCRLENAFLSQEMALAMLCMEVEGVEGGDSSVFRSLARAAVSASADVAAHAHSHSVITSMSPHICMWQQPPGTALGSRLQLGTPGSAYAQHSAKAGLDLDDPSADGPMENDGALEDDILEDEPSTPAVSEMRWVVSSCNQADVGDHTPKTGSSPTVSGSSPLFTDPLRRMNTVKKDDLMLSESASPNGGAEVKPEGDDAANQESVVVLQGLKLYESQKVFISMACRNPRKQVLCEPPTIKRIDFYSPSDLSLAGFITAAAPHPQKKCQHPNCLEGVTSHVRTFLHVNARITLSIATLPLGEALPGEDMAQIWMWCRPKGMPGASKKVRRIALSPEASCLSFGLFLHLCFATDGLEICGPLHQHFVRYFGIGRTVMCLHQDVVKPASVDMTAITISYTLGDQMTWLMQEGSELCKVADRAFDALEAVLRKHPSLSGSPNMAPAPGIPSALLSALFKDRSCISYRVAECMERTGQHRQTENGPDHVVNDVQSGLQELCRLRRSLALAVLTWLVVLEDPSFVAQALEQGQAASDVIASYPASGAPQALADGEPASAVLSNPAPSGQLAMQSLLDLFRSVEPGALEFLEGTHRVLQAIKCAPLSGRVSGATSVRKEQVACRVENEEDIAATDNRQSAASSAVNGADGVGALREKLGDLDMQNSPRSGAENGGKGCYDMSTANPFFADLFPSPMKDDEQAMARVSDEAAPVGPYREVSLFVQPRAVSETDLGASMWDRQRLPGTPPPDSSGADRTSDPSDFDWGADPSQPSAVAGALLDPVLVNRDSSSGECSLPNEEPSSASTLQSLDARSDRDVPAGHAGHTASMDSLDSAVGMKIRNIRPLLQPAEAGGAVNTQIGLSIGRAHLPGRTLLLEGMGGVVTPVFDSEPTSAIALCLSSKSYHQKLAAARETILQEAPSNDPDNLSLLLSRGAYHIKHQCEDNTTSWGRARFQVVAYYAPQFSELRRRCVQGGEAAFTTSLLRCHNWASRGGKSNAFFAKTRDGRYVVKSLSKPEKGSFLEFAPAYFRHMAQASHVGTPTCLAKVVGMFQVAINAVGNIGGAPPSSFKDGVLDVLVMENVFYGRHVSRIYDLKGSERSRYNAGAAANPQDECEVHLDDNLRRSNLQAPLLVEYSSFRKMERALWSDTAFLSQLGVMDYSLLVGVDKENNQLLVAIIDYIRQYTWDKQLETWVKSSGLLGGGGKEPTIISPKQYMRRFRIAISSYFTVVPGTEVMEPPLDPDAV